MTHNNEVIERAKSRLESWTLDPKEAAYATALLVRLEERDVPVVDSSDEAFTEAITSLRQFYKDRVVAERATDLVQRVLGRNLIFRRKVQDKAERAVESRVPKAHAAFTLLVALHVIGHKISKWTDKDIDVLTKISTALSDEVCSLRNVLEIVEYVLEQGGLDLPDTELTVLLDEGIETVFGERWAK